MGCKRTVRSVSVLKNKSVASRSSGCPRQSTIQKKVVDNKKNHLRFNKFSITNTVIKKHIQFHQFFYIQF